jgi:2-oxoisovalerate dehydrogenase E1 component beta subunit
MKQLSLSQAINRTLRAEMHRDDRVVVLGEDVGEVGGLFGATDGLLEEFGDTRVLDTASAEGGIVGTAVGMALYGLRPVAEIQFADFVYPGFDQIVSEMAKARYRSGGQYACPVVLRLPCGGGVGGGIYQSQSPEAHFCHTPGLVVVMPSNAADAAGLLRSALRSADPVVFLEPKRLYHDGRAEVDEEQAIPFGQAAVRREGADVSLFTYGGCVGPSLEAAEVAAERGIQTEVVDLRTLQPLDIETVLASIAKTGRAVVVAEAPRTGSYAAEIAATLAERAILHLEAPVLRVSGFDTPVPLKFEDAYLPDSERVLAAIERVANF